MGGSIGFQQYGTMSLNFALGKKDGYYHNKTADFYQDLLHDAAQIHVVLQDMEDHRAWLANAEIMILHIILHHHAVKSSEGNSEMIQLQAANPGDPFSVRQAMIANADIVIRNDKHMNEATITSKRFQDLVSELYTLFEGLMATQEELAKETGLEINFDRANHLHGWEYLDLVNRKLHPQPRRTQLRDTCGRWPKLMREINAVVLFGVRFQEAIQPTADVRLCPRLKTLPKGKDYLAMEVNTLQKLYLESGSSEQEDQAQLTLLGTQLHRSTHLFEPCPSTSKRSTAREGSCACERVQQVVFKKSNAKITKLQCPGTSGAIIVGQGSATWIGSLSRSISSAKSTLLSQSSSKTYQRRNSPPVKQPTTQKVLIRQDALEPIGLAPTQDLASISSKSTKRSGNSISSARSTEPTSTTSSASLTRGHSHCDTTRFKPLAYPGQELRQERLAVNNKDQRTLQPEVMQKLPSEELFAVRSAAQRSRQTLNAENPRNNPQPIFEDFASPPLPLPASSTAQKPIPKNSQAWNTPLDAGALPAAPRNGPLDATGKKPMLRRKLNFV